MPTKGLSGTLNWISKRGNLSFVLRSESAIIDYKFNALTSDESFSAHPRDTNLDSAQYYVLSFYTQKGG